MYIVAQNRQSVLNLDSCLGLAVRDGLIMAKANPKEHISLGVYPDERAQEVFTELLECFPEDGYWDGTFYMPEE